MKDKDTKLIWESFNEGRRPGDEDDFDPTDYTSSKDPDDIERYRGLHNLERDIARDRGEEDDPWGETDAEKQTKEDYTPVKSLQTLQQGIATFMQQHYTSDDYEEVQSIMYDAMAKINDKLLSRYNIDMTKPDEG